MSKVSEFPILSYIINRKLGNLGKCSFTSNFDSSCILSCKNDKKLTETKAQRSRYAFRRKIKKLESFQVFHFVLCQNGKLGDSESFFFNSNFDSGCNLRFRNDKKLTKRKTWRSRYAFRKKKRKFRRFPSFWFCPISKLKTQKCWKVFFYSNFDSNCNLRPKKHKKLTERKTWKFRYAFKKNTENFRGFQIFDFVL